MPAQRVTEQAIGVARFDVVGQDSEAVMHFVRHVGLAGEQRDELRLQDTIPLTHMGPPLEQGASGPVHARGTVPLTTDEIQQISVFVDELSSEYRAHGAGRRQQYVIQPHVRAERAPDGTVKFYRFNCAGFVIEAYREAGIVLLLTTEDALPLASLTVLVSAYPDGAHYLDNPSHRSRFGLQGDGPWPVVLAGYVLNALARQEGEIRSAPYRAIAGDEFFPPRR